MQASEFESLPCWGLLLEELSHVLEMPELPIDLTSRGDHHEVGHQLPPSGVDFLPCLEYMISTNHIPSGLQIVNLDIMLLFLYDELVPLMPYSILQKDCILSLLNAQPFHLILVKQQRTEALDQSREVFVCSESFYLWYLLHFALVDLLLPVIKDSLLHVLLVKAFDFAHLFSLLHLLWYLIQQRIFQMSHPILAGLVQDLFDLVVCWYVNVSHDLPGECPTKWVAHLSQTEQTSLFQFERSEILSQFILLPHFLTVAFSILQSYEIFTLEFYLTNLPEIMAFLFSYRILDESSESICF